MARELQFINSAYSSETLYMLLFNSTGSVWDVIAGAWDSWADADIDDYDIALTEQGSSGYFNGDMPSVAPGVYSFTVRQQTGAAPAVTDADLGSGVIQWNGSEELALATLNDITAADVWGYTTRTLTSFGALVTNIWSNATRTLTSASTAPGVGLAAQKWAVLRGDNLERTFETIAADSSITKAQITVKTSAEITDDDAVIAVDSESGLIRLNGESPGVGQTASFSISSGDLEIPASVVAEIEPRNYSYDVQVWRGNAVATIEIGKFIVTGDITRASAS